MAKRSIVVDRWNGGLSSSLKEGREGSYAFGRSLSTHEDSSYAKILSRTTKESSTTVTGLIIDMCRVPDGTVYAVDSDKKFYKRTTGASWSVIGTISGDTNGMGIFYWVAKDTIYITTDQSITTYGPIRGTPSLSENKYDKITDQTMSIAASDYPQTGNIQGHWAMDDAVASISYPQSGNIQGHWDLDEASGTRADSSGNSNTLQDNATVTRSIIAFKEGSGSANFELSNSEYLNITDGSQTGLDITGDLSFACWVQLEQLPSTATTAFALCAKDASGDRGYNIEISAADKIFAEYYETGGSNLTQVQTTSAFFVASDVGKLVHVVVTMDVSAQSIKFYKNGVLVAASDQTTTASSIANSGANFALGTRGSFADRFFDGLMDDAVIWDKELTGTEVSDFYDTYFGDRTDSSGNANTITEPNTPVGLDTTNQVEGTGAADFEEANDNYLEIANGDQTGLDITGAMTIAFHVRPESVAAAGDIVAKWDSSDNDRAHRVQLLADGKIQFDVSDNGTNETTVNSDATTLSAGTTYHVACVYTPSQKLEIYIDKVSANTNTTSIPASINNSAAPFRVGADENGDNGIDGLVDDLAIWNVVLTSADVTTVANVPGNYVPLTSITETAVNQFFFTPELDPQRDIIVNISDKGSGNWTVAIHDDDDNEVATSTVANGSLTGGADNTFTFSTQFRPVLGAKYHAHITSTVADGAVTSGNSLTMKAGRLVDPTSAVHPIEEFLNFLVIANERYLCTYDGLRSEATTSGKLPSSWVPHSIVLPSGYEVTCLARFDEYLVAGAEYRGTNIDDFSQGLLIFWDGTSPDFNFFLQVDEGGVSWLLPIKNKLYFGAGLRGEVFVYGDNEYVKLKRLPKMTDKTYIKSLFSSPAIYQGAPLFGYGFDTNSTVFEHGVYAYTSKESPYNDVWTYDYPISTGTRTGTTVKIGAVKAYGTDLLIAWRDGSSYGVDLVSPSANPFTSAVYESLIYDGDYPYVKKTIGVIRVDHKALAANESVQISYKIDQQSTWQNGTANDVDDSTETRFHINKEFKDLQAKITLVATTTSPQINQLTFDVEDNVSQADAI